MATPGRGRDLTFEVGRKLHALDDHDHPLRPVALGMVSGATMGWWIHVLLVLAVIMLIFAVLRRGAAAV